MSVPIAILLATYNGALYLEAQIASLQAQTRQDWRLYVGDDGSTDPTVLLLKRLAAADERIVILRDATTGRGACGRFLWLLEQARERHQMFFFCDQDDVWHPEKVARMARVVERGPARQPLLVHCDLAVVDASLRVVEPSYLTFKGLKNPTRRRSTALLALDNSVTGCACVINRALADRALPLPATGYGFFMMHDWWLALVASHQGRIVTLPEALVLYRQHERNTVGAGGILRWQQRFAIAHVASRLSSSASRDRVRRLLVGEPLSRLRIVQERFGGLDDPIRLLARGRRRDLLTFLLRYCAGHQPPGLTTLVASDILRGSGRPRTALGA